MSDSQMILVINNDPNLLFTLTALLGNAGYRVAGASSLAEGLHCLEIENFNLVLLDLEHPFFEEQQLLVEIHLQDPHVPILLLTRRREADVPVPYEKSFACAALLKPVDPALILQKIAAILETTPRRKEFWQAPERSIQKVDLDSSPSP